MPIHQGCIATLVKTAAEVSSFINSGEGQLLIALMLGAETLARRLRRLPGQEPRDLANTLMVSVVIALFILATEAQIDSYIETRVSQCMGSPITVAVLDPRRRR